VQLRALLQANDAALRPPQHGARHVEGRGRRRPTRDDERIRQRKAAFQVDDLTLGAAGKVGRHHREVLFQLGILGGVCRQLGTDGE
jgi:hypothetical protein